MSYRNDEAARDCASEAAALAEKAERCRRLASGVSDMQASEVLRSMAVNYEESAARLQQA
jgi:hypothetical protein